MHEEFFLGKLKSNGFSSYVYVEVEVRILNLLNFEFSSV